MKWETGNVININGICNTFDWEWNQIRLHKLGRIVNSVPPHLRGSHASMPRLTPKCWMKHIAADNYRIPHSVPRRCACYCLAWNFICKKWSMSHISRGKLRSLSLLSRSTHTVRISVGSTAAFSTWAKVSLSFSSIFGVWRSVIVPASR